MTHAMAPAPYPVLTTWRAEAHPAGRGPRPWSLAHLPKEVPAAHAEPYLGLHQMGFAQPDVLPRRWCALTAPFHPYRPHVAARLRRFTFCCTIPSLAGPGVTWHPVLWCSDFPPRRIPKDHRSDCAHATGAAGESYIRSAELYGYGRKRCRLAPRDVWVTFS